MSIIKVGYLISYDYEFVKTSLPRVYNSVTEIVLAVDINRKTWAGEDFIISDDFWKWISEIDVENKITIYQDDFSIPGLTTMECDTRERNILGKRMGTCDWYVQIDSDEYFLDFEAFALKLRNFKPTVPTTICCNVTTLFKEVNTGYLVIDESVETLSFATNNPVYHVARNNQSGNEHLYWDDLVLHQSWARTPAEIKLKLTNWGHKDDFNTTSLYKLWDAIDEFNYYCLSNFHPLSPRTWPKLKFIPGRIDEILNSPQLKELRGKKDLSSRKKKSFLSRLWKKIKSSS